MEKQTRELMDRIERELGTSIEWVAATYHNTDHRHTDGVVRGVDSCGLALLLDRQFVQRGIRHIAQDLCTRQFGYCATFLPMVIWKSITERPSGLTATSPLAAPIGHFRQR